MTALISIWALAAILVTALTIAGIAHKKQQETIQLKYHLGQLRHQAEDSIDTIEALQTIDINHSLSDHLNNELLTLLYSMEGMGDKSSFTDGSLRAAKARREEFIKERNDTDYTTLETDGEISIAHDHLQNTHRLLRKYSQQGKLVGEQYSSLCSHIKFLHLKIDVDVHKIQGDKYLEQEDSSSSLEHWQHALDLIQDNNITHPILEDRKLTLQKSVQELKDEKALKEKIFKDKAAAAKKLAAAKKAEKENELKEKMDAGLNLVIRKKPKLASGNGPVFISSKGKMKQM